SNADEDAGNAGLHQLQRGFIVDAVTGDDRNRQPGTELFEGELLVAPRDVPRSEHRPLDNEAVGTRLRDQAGTPAGVGGHGGNAHRDLGTLDGGDPLANQLLPNWSPI